MRIEAYFHFLREEANDKLQELLQKLSVIDIYALPEGVYCKV